MQRGLLAAILLSSFPSITNAQTMPTQQGIVVSNAWARASAGASTTGAVYFTVTDNAAADRLTGVSTPVAASAELHQTRNENGVVQMRPVPSLPLGPGKTVTLAPGSYHVMLMGLKQPLKIGDSFPLTLTFEHASPVTVQVKVAAAGAAAPMSHDTGGPSGLQHMGGSKP